MDRFFTDVYPYFPFVDEELFKKELLRIVGPKVMMMFHLIALELKRN